MEEPTVVAVFTGGEPPPAEVARRIPPDARVIAADSGLDHAHRLGLQADLLVGDLDSVSVDATRRHTAAIERHAEDKDQTDLELAMEVASREGETVMVVGGHGGRLDHFLANAALLADRRWSSNRIVWLAGSDLATVIHRQAALHGAPEDLVSILPLGGPARGVTTKGLQWPLQDATLIPGSTRGISNRFLGTTARISVAHGVLMAVQPNAVSERPTSPCQPRN